MNSEKVYINEHYMKRIDALRDKADLFIIENQIPISEWETFVGYYRSMGGMRGTHINGLSLEEKEELKMLGFYTSDEFFYIQRDA